MAIVLRRLASPCRWIDQEMADSNSGAVLREPFYEEVALLVRHSSAEVTDWWHSLAHAEGSRELCSTGTLLLR